MRLISALTPESHAKEQVGIKDVYRWISAPLLILLFLLGIGSTFWYFTFGWDTQPDERTPVRGLHADVQIERDESGVPWVTASNASDLFAGVGYVHGLDRGWTSILWRQAALGMLSEWYGDGAAGFDRFTRQLGLAAQAREAYLLLPAQEQDFLKAYSEGINAALRSRTVRLADPLALAGVDIEPWQPWHTLAVERLFAWLATTPPAPEELNKMDPEVRLFFKADSTFRELLHLHDFEHSVAVVARDSSGVHLYQRHVFGASAEPIYQDLGLRLGNEFTVAGASLPGTLFFPAGKNNVSAWSILPVGRIHLERRTLDSTAYPIVYERIHSNSGTESLVHIRRSEQGIQFGAPLQRRVRPAVFEPVDSTRIDTARVTADSTRLEPVQRPRIIRPATVEMVRPDSAWTLTWTGFGTVTDAPSWRGLLRSGSARFRLLEGGGLLLESSGRWGITGSPRVQATVNGGVVIGNTPWAQYAAAGLDSLVRRERSLSFDSSVKNTFSSWAAHLAPAMVISIDSVRRKPQIMQEALTYLHNWDYSYDRASIAASIFDSWVTEFYRFTGRMPDLAASDSLSSENIQRYQSLLRSLHRLRSRFGSDMSLWRWERINPDRRIFPVWSADSLLTGGRSLLSHTRYAPVILAGKGHPSTLFWDSSPVLLGRPAPASWEGWADTGTWSVFTVRRYLFDFSRFLGRYRLSDELPDPIRMQLENSRVPITRLVPSGSSNV